MCVPWFVPTNWMTGELRYNLIGDSLIGVIHKKPKEGGISAVGGEEILSILRKKRVT